LPGSLSDKIEGEFVVAKDDVPQPASSLSAVVASSVAVQGTGVSSSVQAQVGWNPISTRKVPFVVTEHALHRGGCDPGQGSIVYHFFHFNATRYPYLSLPEGTKRSLDGTFLRSKDSNIGKIILLFTIPGEWEKKYGEIVILVSFLIFLFTEK
jgi:hypothetical protein